MIGPQLCSISPTEASGSSSRKPTGNILAPGTVYRGRAGNKLPDVIFHREAVRINPAFPVKVVLRNGNVARIPHDANDVSVIRMIVLMALDQPGAPHLRQMTL